MQGQKPVTLDDGYGVFQGANPGDGDADAVFGGEGEFIARHHARAGEQHGSMGKTLGTS